MSFFFKIKRKIYKLFHPSYGEILMLHRVVNQRSTLEANKQLEITSDFLERSILDYKAKGYKFVSLNQVAEIVTTQKRPKQKFVCFTFDDGYVDNYEIAYPIFKKFNCPFAIYVTTDFMESKALIWWYILDDLIQDNTILQLSDGSLFSCLNIEEKNTTFYAIRNKISGLQPESLKETFSQWFSNYNFSFEAKAKELSLNQKQIISLAQDSLCTIASHTITHPYLGNMTVEQQQLEMKESKQKLEQLIHKPVSHFAYPFGNYNADSIKLAKENDYVTATLAWGGKLRKGQSPWLLTRISLIE